MNDMLKLASKPMKDLVSKILTKLVRKKFEKNVAIYCDDLCISNKEDGMTRCHVELDISMNSGDFFEILKKFI